MILFIELQFQKEVKTPIEIIPMEEYYLKQKEKIEKMKGNWKRNYISS